MVFDYYSGGAGDEMTVAENRRAWQQVRLRPRVLVDVGTARPDDDRTGPTSLPFPC